MKRLGSLVILLAQQALGSLGLVSRTEVDDLGDILQHKKLAEQPQPAQLPVAKTRIRKTVGDAEKAHEEEGEGKLEEESLSIPMVDFRMTKHLFKAERGMANATDWYEFYSRDICSQRRGRVLKWVNPIYQYQAPLVYSESLKLAYLKTPSAASEAFFSLFFQNYNDARYVQAEEELPSDTFVFTFVGSPLRRVLTAYAHADMVRQVEEKMGRTVSLSTRSIFHKVDRHQNNGVDRFSQFLDDLASMSFGNETSRVNWQPESSALQLSGIVNCKNQISFIGHLENVAADWDSIQRAAGVPKEFMTVAELTSELRETRETLSLPREIILKDSKVVQQICDMYALDYSCLGYQAPADCWKNFQVDSAVYRGIENHDLSFDVTDKVNDLLQANSLTNMTGGKGLNDVFGDPAVGELKELFLQKGHRQLALTESSGLDAEATYDISGLLPGARA